LRCDRKMEMHPMVVPEGVLMVVSGRIAFPGEPVIIYPFAATKVIPLYNDFPCERSFWLPDYYEMLTVKVRRRRLLRLCADRGELAERVHCGEGAVRILTMQEEAYAMEEALRRVTDGKFPQGLIDMTKKSLARAVDEVGLRSFVCEPAELELTVSKDWDEHKLTAIRFWDRV
jgi:hypothetical protein